MEQKENYMKENARFSALYLLNLIINLYKKHNVMLFYELYFIAPENWCTSPETTRTFHNILEGFQNRNCVILAYSYHVI